MRAAGDVRERPDVFVAVVFLGGVCFAGVFVLVALVVVLVVLVFSAVVFLAAVFLAVVFFAGDLFAVVFLAVVFLAVVFLALGFVAVVFFAVALRFAVEDCFADAAFFEVGLGFAPACFAVDFFFATATIRVPPGECERRTLPSSFPLRRDFPTEHRSVTTGRTHDAICQECQVLLKFCGRCADEHAMVGSPTATLAEAEPLASTGPPGPLVDPETTGAGRSTRQETVLIWAQDPDRRSTLTDLITATNWLPLVARSGDDAVRIISDAPPDLFLLAIDDRTADDVVLIDRARDAPEGEHVPIVCVIGSQDRHRLAIDAFARRADDVVASRIDPDELIARIRTRIDRRPVPRSRLVEDPVTGALTFEAFDEQLRKEEERVRRGGEPGAFAFLAFDELPELSAEFGSRGRDELLAQVVRLIKADGRRLDFIGWRRGMLSILLPDTPIKGAQARFGRLVQKIYDQSFVVDGTPVRLTPVIGYTATKNGLSIGEVEERAWDASMYEADQLDLHPTKWNPAMSRTSSSTSRLGRAFERFRTPLQVALQQISVLALPFITYVMLDRLGIDITGLVYVGLVFALGVTATLIWGESHTAIEPTVPPDAPDGPPPRASAIIAAYLPNEAGTVVETVEAFLAQDYPDLEVILAYNTPQRLDVEDELRAIAVRDPRFRPLRVEGSVSKAQNVNAAIAHVTGEFVGLFDADHHPAPGSFDRAWRWIADGAGVVQGHCVIRNGDTNIVTKLVATEFEAIYAVSHPGRARLHGFGIFGGSNGYWRTSLLHRTRMRGAMLTEDIDSSMRVVQSGEVIISDPDLVSTELAPETATALWNQRLRWAQGWSQVSLRHLIRMTRNAPTLRQRFGVAYLLGWREIYPWISMQMFPLLAYWWYQGSPKFDWFVPIFVFTTLLTFSAGPAQTWYAWRLAHPSIKRHKAWFVLLGFASLFFYTEAKNVVGRTAHIKELMRERKWKVTPRTGSVALDAEAPMVDPEPAEAEPPTTDPTPDAHAAVPAPTRPTASPAVATPAVTTPIAAGPTAAGPTRTMQTTGEPAAAEPHQAIQPAPAAAPPSGATGTPERVAEVPSRRRRATGGRRRRHGPRIRTAVASTVERPSVYDRLLEPAERVIYDHEQEVDEPAGPARPDGRVTAPTAGNPLRSALYEPDYAQQVIHRDRYSSGR